MTNASPVTTDLTINFSYGGSAIPFDLVEDEGEGNEPIQVHSETFYSVWDENAGQPPQYDYVQRESCTKDTIEVGILKPDEPNYNSQTVVYYPSLSVGTWGRKRIRLYCCEPNARRAVLRTLYSGDSVSVLGRRSEPFVESINWSNSKIGRLKYNYDLHDGVAVADSVVQNGGTYNVGGTDGKTPTFTLHGYLDPHTNQWVTPMTAGVQSSTTFDANGNAFTSFGQYESIGMVQILDCTFFMDANGALVNPPVYDPFKQEFRSDVEVTGTLVVRYEASYTLLEVLYGTGQSFLSADRWMEIVDKWNHGNINDAQVPQVRMLAYIPGKSAQIAFQRQYNPNGNPNPDFHPPPRSGGGTIFQMAVPNVIYPSHDPIPQTKPIDPEKTKTRAQCWKENVSAYWPSGLLKDKPCSDATKEEKDAVDKCQEANADITYQWVEVDRNIELVRIYSSSNPSEYIDVKRVVAIEFEARRTDTSNKTDPNPPKNVIYRYLTKDQGQS